MCLKKKKKSRFCLLTWTLIFLAQICLINVSSEYTPHLANCVFPCFKVLCLLAQLKIQKTISLCQKWRRRIKGYFLPSYISWLETKWKSEWKKVTALTLAGGHRELASSQWESICLCQFFEHLPFKRFPVWQKNKRNLDPTISPQLLLYLYTLCSNFALEKSNAMPGNIKWLILQKFLLKLIEKKHSRVKFAAVIIHMVSSDCLHPHPII